MCINKTFTQTYGTFEPIALSVKVTIICKCFNYISCFDEQRTGNQSYVDMRLFENQHIDVLLFDSEHNLRDASKFVLRFAIRKLANGGHAKDCIACAVSFRCVLLMVIFCFFCHLWSKAIADILLMIMTRSSRRSLFSQSPSLLEVFSSFVRSRGPLGRFRFLCRFGASFGFSTWVPLVVPEAVPAAVGSIVGGFLDAGDGCDVFFGACVGAAVVGNW